MDTSLRLARLRMLCRSGTARRIRLALDIGQADIAHDVHTTPGAISHWELNRRVPRDREAALRYLDILEKLAPVAGISLDAELESV